MKNRVLMCSIMALLIVSCIRQNNTPKEYIKQINASSFSSKEEADLARAFSTGAFDLSSYREAQHFIQEQIENRIRFSDFSRTDLYATEENISPSDILMKITELKEKNDIQQLILYAARENRVIYSVSAFSQGDTTLLTGTLITIIPKYDENGKIKGWANQGRQVFIPNFR